MNAGRELDALVAVHVMGFVCDGDMFRRKDGYGPFGFAPSTDVKAVLEVVEKMRARECMVTIRGSEIWNDPGYHLTRDTPWRCSFTYRFDVLGLPASPFRGGHAQGFDLLPTICLAALKAVGVEVPA